MDLNVVYSKTAKGMRARTSLIGGLSAHLMRVLTHIDGTSKADMILFKYSEISEQELAVALTQLESQGYIRQVTNTRPNNDHDWSLNTIFAPMEVEEILSEEEAEARAKEAARLAEEHKAKIKEETRLQAERKAREKEEQAHAKEKLLAETKVKALLETERKVKEAQEARQKAAAEQKAKAEEKARIEAERKAKAEEEARIEAENKAKIEEEARQKAEKKAKTEEEARQGAEAKLEAERQARLVLEAKLAAESKAREEAEQAKVKADAEHKKAEEDAKEQASREIERIAREAEEEQKKSAAEAQAKLEEVRLAAALKAKAEAETKLNAERQAREAAEEKLAAERKAKADEEDKKAEEARKKAELKAKEEAEAKAKAEEEKATQLEAERKAKAEAEEKTKAQEKERARLEIARIVREAEEARKKAEAEAKEQRQEAKRKAKAEEDAKAEAKRGPKTVQARLKAESAAKETLPATPEVEDSHKLNVREQASLVLSNFVLGLGQSAETAEEAPAAAIEAEARSQAKDNTITQHMRAKVKAQEQADAQTKEVARLEMERIAQEAEQERQKHEAARKQQAEIQTKPLDAIKPTGATKPETVPLSKNGESAIEVKWGADSEMEEVENGDAFEEEEHLAEEEYKIKREIDKKNKQEAEAHGRADIRRSAKAQAVEMAKIKASGKIINYGKWLAKVKKLVLVYVPLVILAFIALLHFINISPLIEPIEKLASTSLGEKVKIAQVHASLWPQPHLVLGDVVIGNSNQHIEAVNVVPETSSLSETVKTVKSIEIEGLSLEQDQVSQPSQWINRLGKAEQLHVEQINLKKIMLKMRDFQFGPFNGKVALDDAKQLKTIDLQNVDKTVSLQLTPSGESADFVLTGTNWPLPMNTKIVFDEIKAHGKVSQGLVYFSQVEGEIYGGNLVAKGAVDWSNQWSASGNFDISKATLPRMLKAFGSTVTVDGKVNLAGNFASKANAVANLADAPEITASFEVLDGKIHGVDLTQAVHTKSNQSLVGDATRFDKLTGSLQLSNGLYQYSKLALDTDQFHARGNVNIQPNQDISGNISADLAAQSRRLQARFDLAGKVNAAQRQ